ncbi:MAG: phosphopantothenoylcysteine decarboxylase [Candidatus Taylorbacteria bacterium]
MSDVSLKNKSILVTAGSTWIPIDSVRVITNIFKGSIGFTIAKMAAACGANVILLLGPSFDLCTYKAPTNLIIKRFKYFDELDTLMTDLLEKNRFDAVIHSAAVSDFQLNKVYSGKIKSDNKLLLELVPTKKIIDYIKVKSPYTYLVKFKLEVDITPQELNKIIIKSKSQSHADLIVGNIYSRSFSDHEAYVLDNSNKVEHVIGRENISDYILNKIYEGK